MTPDKNFYVEQLNWRAFYNSFGYGLEFESATGATATVEYDDEVSELLWDRLDYLDEDYEFNVYLGSDVENDETAQHLLNELDECGFDYEQVQKIVKQLKDRGIEPAKQGAVNLVATNNPETVGTIYYADNEVNLDVTVRASSGGNNPVITARGISTDDSSITPVQVAQKLGGDHVAITRPIDWNKTLNVQEDVEDTELYECGVLPDVMDTVYDY